jgi:DNA-binding transcriptional ArsR family regulator
MVQYRSQLDGSFAALADPTRRGILERLGGGSATISELAEPFGMSLTGMKKHVGILERAELVQTEKTGRARHCTLGPRRLDEAQRWIDSYRAVLDGRLDRLAALLDADDRPPARAGEQERPEKGAGQ